MAPFTKSANVMLAPHQKMKPGSSSTAVARMLPHMIAGFSVLTLIYASLFSTFRESSSILGFPPPAAEFCQDRQQHHHHQQQREMTCARPDLFSFQVVSGLAIVLCGGIGFNAWHVTRRAHTAIPSTPEGRLYGYLREAEFLVAANFTFQFWDFFVSLTIPEHRTAVMLAHHIAAAAVSFSALCGHIIGYNAIFFLGLSEVSSIFLLFVDLARYFPPEPGTWYNSFIYLVAGPFFVVTFIYYRVILWWPVSYQLFQDVHTVTESGRAAKLRPGYTWVLYVMLVLNLPLGLLQLYWSALILQEVHKMLMG
jgi:TLC domain